MSGDERRVIPAGGPPGGHSGSAEINVGHLHELAGFIRQGGNQVGEALHHLNRAREQASSAFETVALPVFEAYGAQGGSAALYDTVRPASAGGPAPGNLAAGGAVFSAEVPRVHRELGGPNPDPERQMRRAHEAAREFFHSWMPGLRRLRDRDEVLAGHTIALGAGYERTDREVAASGAFDLGAPPSGVKNAGGRGAGPR